MKINLLDELLTLVDTTNQVSNLTAKQTQEIKEGLEHVMQTLDAVNSLTGAKTRVNGIPLSEILLPEWAEIFIYPKKVSITGKSEENDLVVRPKLDPDYEYDIDIIDSLNKAIGKAFKTVPTLKNVADMRADIVNLTTTCFASDGIVYNTSKTEPKWPIEVVPTIAGLYGDYVECYPQTTIEHLFLMLKFSFIKK